jgi:hypothetical protein
VARTPDDGVVLTGVGLFFDGFPAPAPGQGTLALGKVSNDGALVWAKQLVCDPDQGIDSSRVAVPGSDVVLLADCEGEADLGTGPLPGAGGSDVVVARYDAAGTAKWVKRFGDGGFQEATEIAATATGTTLISGIFEGTIDLGAGPLIASPGASFVAELDVDGQPVWGKVVGAADGGAVVWGLGPTPDGGVIVTGSFNGTLDLGGGALVSAGLGDLFVAKLDAVGEHVWSKRFGDADNQGFARVAVDAAGDVVLVGAYDGTVDFGGGPLATVGFISGFVVKLDAGGGHLWSKRFGDELVKAGEIALSASGNVYITGGYIGGADLGGGPLPNGGCIFVGAFDPSGAHLWSGGYPAPGGIGDQAGSGIAVDGAGAALVTGWFDGEVDFGHGPLLSAGDYDVFLAKLVP